MSTPVSPPPRTKSKKRAPKYSVKATNHSISSNSDDSFLREQDCAKKIRFCDSSIDSSFEAEMADTSKTSVTLEDIMLEVRKNGQRLETLTNTIEQIEGTMHELRVENDKLKREVTTLKQKEEELRGQLAEVKHTASVTLNRANDTDQYSRRNNIRIYGLKEKEREKAGGGGAGALKEDTEAEVLQLCADMGVPLKPDDIEAAHRLGTVSSTKTGTPRGVIVRFVNRKQKERVIKNRRKLKDSGIVMVEDLTDTNYKLFQHVRADPLSDKVWTINGKVTMKTRSGKIVKVHSLEHLEQNRAQWAK